MERLPKRTRKISTAEALGLDRQDSSDRAFLRYERLLLSLRKIMRRQGTSVNLLAEKLGVTRQAIYDRFSGRNTSLEWIVRVAEALGVDIKVTLVEHPIKHGVEMRQVA